MNYNTVIIGSGVAGMTSAIYLKRAHKEVCILENNVPGGQVTLTSTIENYPGFKSITGFDLALNIYNQVKELGVEYKYMQALSIERKDNGFIVNTSSEKITCQNVIIAVGRSPRKLEVKSEKKLIGNGISFCATCDSSLYKNKKVAVIGGGMSALEESLYLSKICSEVTLIHRKDTFSAQDKLIEDVKNINNIKILTNRNVKEFKIDNDKLSGIVLEDNNHNIEEIKVDGCFEYIGQVPNTEIFKDLDIVDSNGYVIIDDNYETKIPGIYAIGDCTKKSLYQIITACSDGANVANRIIMKR